MGAEKKVSQGRVALVLQNQLGLQRQTKAGGRNVGGKNLKHCGG